MKKPSWFQPLDLTVLAIPIVAAAYAFIHGYEAKYHAQAGALLIAVPVIMCSLWGYVMYKRKKFFDSCIWFPTYGFMVQPENYLPPAADEFDKVVASTARSWAPFHPNADQLLRSGVKWLYFRKDLDEKPITPKIGLVEGFTTGWGSLIYVDYDNRLDPLEKTAFQHELGHCIHGMATGGWDVVEHHEFAKKNHLR